MSLATNCFKDYIIQIILLFWKFFTAVLVDVLQREFV